MAKDDFDIDFDFEKEYGFDPEADADAETQGDPLDFSGLEAEFGLDVSPEAEDDFTDFDFSALGLEDEPEPQPEPAAAVPEEPEEIPQEELEPEDTDGLDFDFDADFDDDFEDDILDGTAEDLAAGFHRRADFFGTPDPAEPAQDAPQTFEEPAYDEEYEEDVPFEEEIPQEEPPKPQRRPREPKAPKERKPRTGPTVFQKLCALYFPPKDSVEFQGEPGSPRRKRKSKEQIFKEAYLPAILACVSLVLVLYFISGAVGNIIAVRRIADDEAEKASIAASEAQVKAEQEARQILEEAKRLAAGYDYDGAISMLDTYEAKDSEEINKLKSEYLNAKSILVEYKDPTSIPNLSFHVLIADPERAFKDKEYKGSYNKNFVTIDEFSQILDQLYKNNYILVDYDSFAVKNTGLDGKDSFMVSPIWLPEGKKPFMLTETMVNYYLYMTDSNDDGEPDAGGGGFASRLVVSGGEIKNEYVDADGQVRVGDYDLVPILETFIKSHPDFVYKGARATLAASGYNGVFGYRINTSVVASKGNDYYEQQVAGAKEIAQALQDKGYRIACYTFDDMNYREKNTNQVKADIESWNKQIVSVIGPTDTIVFAKGSDIKEYGGATFSMLHDFGFRIFVRQAGTPSTEVNNTYVRQSRLMVTGQNLAHKAEQFENLFDANKVLNLTARGGSVPKN